jgi:hypothetical protein
MDLREAVDDVAGALPFVTGTVCAVLGAAGGVILSLIGAGVCGYEGWSLGNTLRSRVAPLIPRRYNNIIINFQFYVSWTHWGFIPVPHFHLNYEGWYGWRGSS